MKMFSWMQSKLTGKQRSSNSNASSFTYNHRAKQETMNEEFRDWPHALLAIGTFGNGERGSAKENPPPSSSSEDFPDFTAEEVRKLQEELMKLLSRKPQSRASLSRLKGSSSSSDRYAADLPLDKFLNCPSSLDVDRRISTALCNDPLEEQERDEEDIERTISVILHRCKDLCAEENSQNDKRMTIGKKSISFLLKKMFVCANGFAPPPPTLRHSLQESTMEKLLRTMLHKKLNPRNSHRASSMKKYLGDRHDPRAENEEENKKKAGDGHKWVKTDSEYIVLEI